MSDFILPGGAFLECATHETRVIKRPDGKDATSFAARAQALIAMRSLAFEQNEKLTSLESRVAALEAQPPAPFPPS